MTLFPLRTNGRFGRVQQCPQHIAQQRGPLRLGFLFCSSRFRFVLFPNRLAFAKARPGKCSPSDLLSLKIGARNVANKPAFATLRRTRHLGTIHDPQSLHDPVWIITRCRVGYTHPIEKLLTLKIDSVAADIGAAAKHILLRRIIKLSCSECLSHSSQQTFLQQDESPSAAPSTRTAQLIGFCAS